MIQKHQNTLTVLESLDTGKPVTEARVCDLPLIVRHFYHHAGWAQLMRVEMGGWEPLGECLAPAGRGWVEQGHLPSALVLLSAGSPAIRGNWDTDGVTRLLRCGSAEQSVPAPCSYLVRFPLPSHNWERTQES